MFSVAQKQKIADAVEKVILSFNHPEMPKEHPVFMLHVEGAESWSWADIEPNWTYGKDNHPGINPHNERMDKINSRVKSPDDVYCCPNKIMGPGGPFPWCESCGHVFK